MVELARLESAYTPKGYRGFESPSLRQMVKTHHEVVIAKKDRPPQARLKAVCFLVKLPQAVGFYPFQAPHPGERLAQRGNPQARCILYTRASVPTRTSLPELSAEWLT